jgi:hypothetical protein
LRDAYAASAKQSILKNLGAVKSFLSQCEILQPERLPSVLKMAQHAAEIPIQSRHFSHPSTPAG